MEKLDKSGSTEGQSGSGNSRSAERQKITGQSWR